MTSNDQFDRLNRLFQTYYGLVVAVVRRYAPTPESADDAMQEVYVDFIRGGMAKKFDLDKNVEPLLYHIAKNHARLLWRKRLRDGKRFRPVEEVLERLLDVETTSFPDEYDSLDEQLRLLKECLEKLPSKNREMIEQHYFKDVSMKTLAERQNRNPSTVRHFFYRARLVLKKCIEDQTSDPSD